MTFADAWKKAVQPTDEFDPPDGPYHVKVVDGGAFTGNDGRVWTKLNLEILDGEHKGRQFEDFSGLDENNPTGFRIRVENLGLYGVNVESVGDVEDLDTALLELTGTEVDVNVKHNTGANGRVYLNVNVSRTLTGKSDIPDNQESFDTSDFEAAAAKPRGAYDDDSDEIPF